MTLLEKSRNGYSYHFTTYGQLMHTLICVLGVSVITVDSFKKYDMDHLKAFSTTAFQKGLCLTGTHTPGLQAFL